MCHLLRNICWLLCLVTLSVNPLTAGELSYDRDVRPILAANCFACHGADAESRQADLRLDTAGGAEVAIRPGKPDESDLVLRIESDDQDELMPPPDSGHKLTAEQKAILRQWVVDGGRYELHWSFLAPQVDLDTIPADVHPIDHFVRRSLNKANLQPAPEADRFQLIRRLSLDLIGLPPTPEQADAFVADSSADAYEKLVDRLLASDAFGERWARVWLDLARYADTKGYEKDNPREIWRYRDWLIDAFNDDMPFDQFTVEQIAGDLLPDATMQQRLATAFHRNTLTNEEGGTDDEEFRVAAVKDRVDTTVQVWMGLTMGCAKCHSHKYDPISQADYYRFFAYFNQTVDSDRETPLLSTPTAFQLEQEKDFVEKVALLRAELRTAEEGLDEAFEKWKSETHSAQEWSGLELVEFESEHDIELIQEKDRRCIVKGKIPDKDHWLLSMRSVAGGRVTSLRIETFPKQDEGNRTDKNHVLNELSVEVVGEGSVDPIRLVNARADFSQNNWNVAKSIDGDPETGWAVSPQADRPHVVIYDLAEPLVFEKPLRLRLKMAQTYGAQLVLSRFRVSISDRAPDTLKPNVSDDRESFRRTFPPTKDVLAKLESAENELQQLRSRFPKTPVMQELPVAKRRETRVHVRGNFLEPGEVVEPAVPEAFGGLPEGAPANRLGVAKWLVGPANPLTARVMVNRVWARLFGIGIVETEEDFGTQGLRPSHPQLLDWLARDYRQKGWSLKSLLKTIVLSDTYRQSSNVGEEKLASDPRNRLLSRGPRFRLSAEMIRDQALASSGLLTHKLGGPSVMPPQPDGIWKSTYSNRKWVDAVGEDRYRRGIYTYWKRTSPYPSMTTFDAGSGEVCLVRRVRTNTPLQALITLNDPSYFEGAGALGVMMRDRVGQGHPEQAGLVLGFRRVLVRRPSEAELGRLHALFAEVRDDFAQDLAAAANLVESAGLDRISADADLAAWVTIANVLLNLDETVTKP